MTSQVEAVNRRIEGWRIAWTGLAAPLAALLLCRAAPGAFERLAAELADRVVARVNSTAITLSEVEESVVRRRLSDPQSRQASLRKIYEEELRRRIDEELLFQAAEKLNVQISEEILNAQVEEVFQTIQRGFDSEQAMREALADHGLTLDKLKQSLREREERDLKITQAIATRFTVTDAEAEQFAKNLRAEGKPTAVYHLRQILIRCPMDADAQTVAKAKARAFEAAVAAQRDKSFDEGGALRFKSFDEAVRQYSDDKQTRDSGGDLGYVDEGVMMPALEEAVKKLDIGQLSQPARSETGFHVFLLVNKRTPRKLLFAERFDEERTKWLAELRRTQTIETQTDFLDLVPQ